MTVSKLVHIYSAKDIFIDDPFGGAPTIRFGMEGEPETGVRINANSAGILAWWLALSWASCLPTGWGGVSLGAFHPRGILKRHTPGRRYPHDPECRSSFLARMLHRFNPRRHPLDT